MANDKVPAAVGATYEDGPVRAFALAAVLWGVVGMGSACSSPRSWPGRS